jgi:putative salt-induced outer membrane protein YdiY
MQMHSNNCFKILLLGIFLFAIQASFAQKDTLVMKSNEKIFGEIKQLDNGVLQVETNFSDKDFQVEYDKVVYIHTPRHFLIITTHGERYYGSIKSKSSDSLVAVISEKSGGEIEVNLEEIVFFQEVEDSFWQRLDVELSVGYTLTKANNNQQFSVNFDLGYLSEKSKYNLYFEMIRSFQESDEFTAEISRTNGGFVYRRFIVRDWFMLLNADLLQSSELRLALRSNTKGGVGNYVVKNSKMNLGIAGGVAWAYENYTDAFNETRNSVEAFFAAEYVIFDLGDLELGTKLFAFPSLTEAGRFRSDFNIHVKYDLPLDIFIKLNYTLNYDNQPAIGAPESDYVFQTTLGWEL